MNRIWKFGNDIDTDQIVPGRYAPYMTSEDELHRYAFIEARPEFPEQVKPGDLLVAGENFGCGSSREYAALALKRCGLAAIVAKSFARIFYRNSVNIGLPLFEFDLESIDDEDGLEFDLEHGHVRLQNRVISLPQPPQLFRDAWRADGLVNLVLSRGGGDETA